MQTPSDQNPLSGSVAQDQPASGGPIPPSVGPATIPQVPEPPIPEEAPQQPPPAPEPIQPAETIVVPETVGPGSAPQNSFMPQAPGSTDQPPVQPKSSQTNPWSKRLVMIGIGLLLLIVLGIGGRFAYTMFTANQVVTISYWGLWENDASVRDMLNGFEATHPKIKVQYVQQSPKQYRERLQAALTRGEGPDVFRFHNTWIPLLRSDLLPIPASVMTTSEFLSSFYPVAATNLVSGSSIYGIPLMFDGLGLYYNEDLLSAAGVSVPVTWNDVLAIVPKLTVKNDSGIVTSAIALGTANNIENFSDILAVMMMQNGAKLPNLKGQEATEALMFYHKFADPSDPVYTWNDSLDNSIPAFANAKVAMILAPSWRAFDIRQINPSLHFKVAPIPQLPGTTVTWASYWVEGVSAKSKYPTQALEFLKYVTSKDTAVKLYTSISKLRLFGEPYARIDLGKNLSSDPLVGAYISQAPTAKSFPLASRTFDNGINDNLIKYLKDAVNSLNNGNSPASALDTAQAGFTQVLAPYGLSSAAPTQ